MTKVTNGIKRVFIKTIKTMSQSAVGAIGASAMLSDVNWSIVLSTSILSGILCILMNIADIKESDYIG